MIFVIYGCVLSYEPTFASLDSRPLPSWFQDSKFGLFIHWGVYSVPAWSMKGSYEEWYQMWLNNKQTYGNVDRSQKEVWQHHQETYGKNFSYYDFADMFKAQDYDPKAWAQLFEAAGVKYIVLTTKHHEGWANWASNVTNLAWGFKWTAATAGPKKELIAPLKAELAKTSVHFGLYYSLYEWYNPLIHQNFSAYVNEYMQVQLVDLMNRYEPDLLWTDGDWIANSGQWKSKEFLAWLYTNSTVKDKIVVNGRWGTDMDWKKGPFVGNYMALEFDGGDANATRPWQECRGVGISFGFNQNEDALDINTVQVLLLNLVDRVSLGGNLLLGIGVDSAGKIPVIHQDKILAMGAWLKINGEAIYSTRKGGFQVSPNGTLQDPLQYKKDHNLIYVPGNFILKQTLQPEPGYAVKQLYFTKKGSTTYMLMFKWADSVLIRKVKYSNVKMTMLETNQTLTYTVSGEDTVVTMPAFDPNKIKSNYIWVVRITPS